MYQDFFKLGTLPFNLTPNPDFFCQLSGHQDALTLLQFCIQQGEGFIKIVGEVGSGKTLICRKLLDSLDEHYVTAYIPNPALNPAELRKAFAAELEIPVKDYQDQHELLNAIYHQLIHLHAIDKRVVLIIDEAQILSDESLEMVRLLTNLETNYIKLIQVVLFGQPELDDRLNQAHLRQFKQRISFSYYLPLLNRQDFDVYLNHRLATAGYTRGDLFTNKSKKLLYHASKGVPRLINILSHKALLVAYGRGEYQIDHKMVSLAIKDTEAAYRPKLKLTAIVSISIAILFLLTSFFL